MIKFKKIKMIKKTNFFKIFLVIFLILILFLFVGFKIISFIEHTKLLNKHSDYFELPKNNQKVESWMTFFFIKQYFDFEKGDIEKILGKNIKFKEIRGTLDDYCIIEKIDCIFLTEKFNLFLDNRNINLNNSK